MSERERGGDRNARESLEMSQHFYTSLAAVKGIERKILGTIAEYFNRIVVIQFNTCAAWLVGSFLI
jgi:hypothetical protein